MNKFTRHLLVMFLLVLAAPIGYGQSIVRAKPRAGALPESYEVGPNIHRAVARDEGGRVMQYSIEREHRAVEDIEWKKSPEPTVIKHIVSITFTGTVKSVELLSLRHQGVVTVDADPRFALAVEIDSVTPDESPLKSGVEQIFAIHSPARLFRTGSEDILGKKYRFTLNWEKVGSVSRFSRLTATSVAGEKVELK